MSNKAFEFVKAVSQGEDAPAPFNMAWGLQEGMRGATWTTVRSDGVVLSNTIKPSRGPFVPSKPTELGTLTPGELQTFCAILCAQRFDLIQPPPMDPSLMHAPTVELAISVPDERFSLSCPSPKLEECYGLAEIGRVFGELRKRFTT